MKILYIFPGIGLMLLMTLRMLGDLRQFLVLLLCVLAAFASALYVWASFWNPILLEAAGRAGDPDFGTVGVLLTWWRMVDEALLNTTPMHVIVAGRSATVRTVTYRYIPLRTVTYRYIPLHVGCASSLWAARRR